jgi:hypothetical protein
MSIARGFIGSHVFAMMGTPGDGGFFLQLFDCSKAGSFVAGINTNNPSFPSPRLLMYRLPAGLPDDFGNYQLMLDKTGAQSAVSGSVPVGFGDVVLVSVGQCQQDFRGIHTAYIDAPPPALGAPGNTTSRFGNVQLTQPPGETGCSLWFRINASQPWQLFSAPTFIGKGVTIQAMATKEGRSASPIVQFTI